MNEIRFTESWRLGKNNSISSHKNQEWRKYVKACILELNRKKMRNEN